MRRIERLLRTRTARVGLVITSVVAAISVGGGFLGGVVLAPLLVLVARQASRGASWGYGLLAGVLAAEVAWAAAYVLGGEQAPSIWLVPLAAGLGVVSLAVRGGGGGTETPTARMPASDPGTESGSVT